MLVTAGSPLTPTLLLVIAPHWYRAQWLLSVALQLTCQTVQFTFLSSVNGKTLPVLATPRYFGRWESLGFASEGDILMLAHRDRRRCALFVDYVGRNHHLEVTNLKPQIRHQMGWKNKRGCYIWFVLAKSHSKINSNNLLIELENYLPGSSWALY